MNDMRFKRLFNAINQNDEMRDQYDKYLEEHISGVKKGLNWLYANLPELFKCYDADYLGNLISYHDDSKYDVDEYYAYCEYFYGNNRNSPEVQEEFDYAWLHHQHNNPHHWQHWLLREDDGSTKALEMPYDYILEMICDWWSFSWRTGNLYEIFTWYETNSHKIVLHEKSKASVEHILTKLKEKLDELNGNQE